MSNYVRMSIFHIFKFNDSWKFIVLRTLLHMTVQYFSAYGHGNDRGRMSDQCDAKHVKRMDRARLK